MASYGTFPLGGIFFGACATVATWLGGFVALKSLGIDKALAEIAQLTGAPQQ